jgi:peptidoglycan/LPS O-acetylase OafA/YrhL
MPQAKMPGASAAAREERPQPVVAASRLEYVDGIRALAALFVFFHHTIETAEPVRALSVPILGPVLKSLFFGQFPVMVFLLLSGFCLYYPCVRRNPGQPVLTTTFREYLKRRARRIGPPYLAAGVLCLVMISFPAMRVGKWVEAGDVNAGAIISHLLMVHNLFPAYSGRIDYPMWSIGLEWQLYLMFPLMIWGFRRFGGLRTIAAALAMTMGIRVLNHRLPSGAYAVLRDGPLAYLEIFGAGMLAAVVTVRGQRIAPRWVLSAVVIAGFATVRLGSSNGLIHDIAATAAAFCLLVLAVDPAGRVGRVLSTPWLVKIGLFSYSLYLMHAPVLHLCAMALRRLPLSADARFLILSVACLPIILAACYGFHLVFERPFMGVKKPAAPALKIA